MLIEELLYKPQHSLIDQSLHSTTRRGDDERRRLRHRLVRRRRDAGRLPQHRAGLERPEPPRARWHTSRLRAPVRAHPRLVRIAGPADELPSLPPRPLALDAQRADPRVPRSQARARARGRPVAVSGDRGLDRLRAVLLPRAHDGPRGRPARCRRARGRLHRARRPEPRRRAPDPDDGGDDRRQHRVGVPLLEREAVAVALLLDPRGHPATSSIRTTRCCTCSRTRRGSSYRSLSATSPAPGTRFPSRAMEWSRKGRTSCIRSRRALPRNGCQPRRPGSRPARASVNAFRLGGDGAASGRAVRDPHDLATAGRRRRRVVLESPSEARISRLAAPRIRRLVGSAESVVVDRRSVRDRRDVLPRRSVPRLRTACGLRRRRDDVLRRVDLLHLGRGAPVARDHQRRPRAGHGSTASAS